MSYIVQDMNCIFVVSSSVMSEEATFLVEPQLTYWTTVDPSIMESFLVKFQVLTGGSSVVTDITGVEGLGVFSLQVFLQSVSLLGPELTVSDGALEPRILLRFASHNFLNHSAHLCSRRISMDWISDQEDKTFHLAEFEFAINWTRLVKHIENIISSPMWQACKNVGNNIVLAVWSQDYNYYVGPGQAGRPGRHSGSLILKCAVGGNFQSSNTFYCSQCPVFLW